jgi:hypothetical protein
MRGEQLSRLAAVALPGRTVRYTALGTDLRKSVVFLTKGALKAMTMPLLESLKSNGNVLLFDLVDETPPPIVQDYADVIVAASYTAFLELSRLYPHIRVALVNHHVDPRIALQNITPPTDRLRTAYFGEQVNAILSPQIEDRLDVVHIDTSRESSAWIDRLGDYNLHYAVRATRDLDHFKPFLKGFTAAHCGANILIQDSQIEALHWLGSDYPFLLQGPVTDETILAALAHLQDSFGGALWQDGLARMRDVYERTTPARIGAELRAAVAV